MSVKVMPAGSVPVALSVGVGKAVPVDMPAEQDVPTVQVRLLGPMIVGASSMVSVKLCVASGGTPLEAVKVIG